MKRVDPAEITSVVLASAPMRALRFVLDRKDLHVEPKPILYKDVSDTLVRLIFPVTGGPIEDGAIVSLVCLFDRELDQTLYVHPMHAGPEVNPLVRHPGGPMAAPKPQDGADGERANRRIIEHKRALWDRFLQERPCIGEQEAGQRWRDGYSWSLQRLYFCCGCNQCKWGSPFFDGPDPNGPRQAIVATPMHMLSPLDGAHFAIVANVLASEEWQVESAYARRGGFCVVNRPRLIKTLDHEFVQLIFPTDLALVQAGALVAVSFTFHVPSQRVAISHCLAAGPESDIQFLKGDVAFGLPKPQLGPAGDEARAAYQSWRRSGWSQFWLNDLECGLAVASETWLEQFWTALEALFGGNDISCKPEGVSSPARFDASSAMVAERGAAVILPQAIENIGARCFTGHATNHRPEELRALGISTLMVNVGHRCNQACGHCHVDAGPNRTEEMNRETVDQVLRAVRRLGIETLDITGGAPELNPHFRYLASEASRMGCRVVDRCNLTIFFEPGYEDLPEFLAKHAIEVTASLPSDEADIADRQRGLGSFAKSIAALQKLNDVGYGKPNTGLTLNLVYNPPGTDYPEPQDALEARFKRQLSNQYGITFDRLFAMNNMPIKRFEHHLRRKGQWSEYMNRLVRTFNPDTLDGLMCRRTVSVAYDGRLYDCDFNHVLDIPLKSGLPTHVRDLDNPSLQSRLINVAGHCFGCASGAGSSCNGTLSAAPRGVQTNGVNA
jgi:radical SAM/Cys-rich protein